MRLNNRNIIRIILFVFLVFLILDLDLSIKEKIPVSKNSVILQDVSLSVGNLDKKAINIQKKTGIDNLYYFSGILSRDKDEAERFNGLSDISMAVSELSKTFSNIILVTDGNQNPPDRIINTASRIFALRPDEKEERFDISISGMDIPENIYEDIVYEYVFKIFLNGEDPRKSVFEFNSQKEDIVLNKGLNIIRKSLSLKKGMYDMSVSIIPFNDEYDKTNNKRDFKISVKEDKKRFLVSYIYPGPEKAFLGNFLKKHGKLDVNNKEDNRNIDIKYNAVIEFDYSMFSEDSIRSYIEQGGLYMFFSSEKTLGRNVPLIGIPENIIKKRSSFKIYEKYRRFPFFDISDKLLTNNIVWDKISDYDYYVDIENEINSIDLLQDSSTKKDILSVFSFGRGKYILFKFGPIYKMSLLQAVNASDIPVNVYERFLSGLLSYYSSSSESIRFSTDRKTYVIGEMLDISVRSELSDNIILYVNGEKKGENSIRLLLENTGDYVVDARIEADSKKIYENSYYFSVFDSLTESDDVRPDIEYLQNISRKNGGFVFNDDNIDLVMDKLSDFSFSYRHFRPLKSKFVIFLFLFLFCLYMLMAR